MFVQSSSRRDPSNRRAAPLGSSTVEVQTLVPYDPHLWGVDGYNIRTGEYRGDSTYREIKKIVIDGMIDRMEQAIPGAAARVQWSELATPASQERFVGNTGAAPFGLAMSPTQIGPFRPGVQSPITGLFLVGTSTSWGPGTEGSMISGQKAASAILQRDLQDEVQNGAVLTDTSQLTQWGPGFDPLAACRGFSDDEIS
jgi:phytoene dehydrogenase-like protein